MRVRVAGFLIDPGVSELGKKIQTRPLVNRDHAFKVFIERVNKLSAIASTLDIELLVENNVLSHSNYTQFQANPFLMATSDECEALMHSTPGNVNLLIDVAHLKVSAQSLSFDKVAFLSRCDPWIKAYHLSDNNGFSDQNLPFTSDSWFWPFIKKDLGYYSIEVYTNSYTQILDQFKTAHNYLP